jgi:endonuclease YncB( thermonuclease family)
VSKSVAGLALSVVLLLLPVLADAATITGRVVKVVDGDTIDVLQERQTVRIRLNGIDAPETGQPHGKKAKQFVIDLAARQVVRVEVIEKDKYGRSVGDVMLRDGRVLNREIVKAGYAWWYRKYSQDQTLGRLEAEAKSARRGLWQEKNPMAPWNWRKLKRNGGVKPVPAAPTARE